MRGARCGVAIRGCFWVAVGGCLWPFVGATSGGPRPLPGDGRPPGPASCESPRATVRLGASRASGRPVGEDLDPWPGGLLQQYDLGKKMLTGVTGASESSVSDQAHIQCELSVFG